jgi:hypothetical protein
MRPRLLLTGLCLIAFGSALAQTAPTPQNVPPARTAQTLLESCNSNDSAFMMRCTAYLGGVADSMDFMAAYQNTHKAALDKARLTLKPYMFCHNDAWTPDTLRQAFLTWANANPNRLQEDQYVAAVDALHDAYPCR